MNASHHARTLAPLLLALTLAVSPTEAQAEWQRRPLITAFQRLRLAYDSTAQEVLLVSSGTEGATSPTGGRGCEVWAWNGQWSPRSFDGLPAASTFGLAYDRARDRLVRFGGAYTNDDTWEWDGIAWTLADPANRPPPRESRCMVYDEARAEIVLFGGAIQGPSNFLRDTWTYDGTDWTQEQVATRPSARTRPSMVYDALRERVVLFGGLSTSGRHADTWEWDGSAWTLRTPPTSPSGRWRHAMAYDRARGKVVLFGGSAPAGAAADTWEYDGTTWTQRFPANSPPPLVDHAMAFHEGRGRVVLYGGDVSISPGTTLTTRTWEWDGNDWIEIPPVSPWMSFAEAAYDSDRDRVVAFGSSVSTVSDDLWEWDGASWTEREPAVQPPGRWLHALAYDSRRGRTVLYGGLASGGGNLADTWEWDGAQWIQRFPARNPGPQSSHAMAFHAASGRTVLVAALGGGSATWEWDGNDWTPRPGPAPGVSGAAVMAYDAAREVVVLHDGVQSSPGTWEWDGATWRMRLHGSDRPGPRVGSWMVYDAARRRIVMDDGEYPSTGITWEWNGRVWLRRAPHGRRFDSTRAVAYHRGSERVVALSSEGATWEYLATNPARVAVLGNEALVGAGAPVLRAAASSRPWAGDVLELELEPVPADHLAALLVRPPSRGAPLGSDRLLGPGGRLVGASMPMGWTSGLDGRARWRLPIEPALSGTTFHAQAIVLDRTAGPSAVRASNALAARVGTR